MTDSRSRNRRQRAARAIRATSRPAPATAEVMEQVAPAEVVMATRPRGDLSGRTAILLATTGVAFAGFLTVLLLTAASRA